LVLGCVWVPQTRLNEVEAQNRALSAQNLAQLTEIENLRTKLRQMESQLAEAEQQLALAEQRCVVQQRLLASQHQECQSLAEKISEELGQLRSGGWLPRPQTRQRLLELARRHPALCCDAASGLGRIDTEGLFDSFDGGNQPELKAEAKAALAELVRTLNSPEGNDLRVMVIGYADERVPGHRWREEGEEEQLALGTARALAVATALRRAGLPDSRLGVASFVKPSPPRAEAEAVGRQRGGGVEIFLLPSEAPMVGWSGAISRWH
jgi:outer membrane protein OmpA-like peptidoglycan-associated protein